jgi:hypothetical protein
MKKARSRLGRVQQFVEKPNKKTVHSKPKIDTRRDRSYLNRYFKHLPTLVLGLICAAILIGMIFTLYPAQVMNLVIPGSYLLPLILFFLSVFFVSSFVFMNSRRGLFLALYLTILLFLRLKDLSLSPGTFATFALPFLLLEILAILLTKIRAD